MSAKEVSSETNKCAIVVGAAPTDLKSHLLLNAQTVTNYSQMRRIIGSYFLASLASSQPMDVGGIFKGGKGDWKGKKGEAKGPKGDHKGAPKGDQKGAWKGKKGEHKGKAQEGKQRQGTAVAVDSGVTRSKTAGRPTAVRREECMRSIRVRLPARVGRRTRRLDGGHRNQRQSLAQMARMPFFKMMGGCSCWVISFQQKRF